MLCRTARIGSDLVCKLQLLTWRSMADLLDVTYLPAEHLRQVEDICAWRSTTEVISTESRAQVSSYQ